MAFSRSGANFCCVRGLVNWVDIRVRSKAATTGRGDLAFRTAYQIFVAFWSIMFVEGAIRKWIAPGIGVPIQVFRDMLPAAILLLLLQSRVRTPVPPRALLLALIGYLLFGALSAFISGFSYPFLVPILGLRTHFAYIPLIVAFPAFFRSTESLVSAGEKIAIISMPIALLCLYQTTQPTASWVNIYATGESSNAVFGNQNLVRAAGTFSYITGMAQFAVLVFAVSLASVIAVKHRGQRLIFVAGLLAAVVSGIATGSRGPILAMVVILVGVLWLMVRFYRPLFTRFRRLVAWLVIGGTAVAGYAAAQFDAMYERITVVGGDTGGRTLGAIFGWLDAIITHPVGFGLGAGHQQASRFLGGEAGFSLGAEEELTRIALELGFFGFLAFAASRLIFFWQLYRITMATRQLDLRMIAAAATMLFAANITGGLYTPIANAMLWGLSGLYSQYEISASARRGQVCNENCVLRETVFSNAWRS
ncbi:O-antigen ligase family protein [Thermomonas sp. HDW16]|uniref:O-antigen ligase family protein n=1 Tax=Thermomonas sp. HDW16 TaxID=2714945 RepID=UPI00140A8952|nr:O-antigen ligase family protein [Thermomonas sp. HDW16]QIL20509.1 O-antigen ligase family protein [Thermomonas sp. HDW16]